MKDILISQFVDDELDLDEKIDFVETVHDDSGFKNQAIDFLNLEKYIHSDAVERVPDINIKVKHRPLRAIFHPMRIMGAGLAVAAVAILLFFALPGGTITKSPYRFVLFQPDARQVEISGSFTEWKAIPMQKTGFSGYWETTLDLQEGEHRFGYIIEGRERIPDPTIMIREKDDFGGVNSIIDVSLEI